MNKNWQSIDESMNFIKKLCEDGHHPVRLDNKTSVGTFNKG